MTDRNNLIVEVCHSVFPRLTDKLRRIKHERLLFLHLFQLIHTFQISLLHKLFLRTDLSLIITCADRQIWWLCWDDRLSNMIFIWIWRMCAHFLFVCVCVCVCAYLPLCVDMGVIKLLKPALCLMGDCIVCCRSGFKGIKTLLLTWISSIRPSQYHTSTQRPSGCTHTHAFLVFFYFSSCCQVRLHNSWS